MIDTRLNEVDKIVKMSEVKKPAVVVDPVAIGNMTDLFYQVFEIFNHTPVMLIFVVIFKIIDNGRYLDV